MKKKKTRKVEFQDGYCKGPIEEKCENCHQLQWCIDSLMWDTRFPHWLIKTYLKVLSGSALKVFVFLARKANFDPRSNHFGRCWALRKEIAEAAGVSESNLSRQLCELEDLGLIKRSSVNRRLKDDGTWGSTVTITITHFKRMKELRQLRESNIIKN